MSKFLNKLWNIANFIDMNIIDTKFDKKALSDFFDNCIIKKINMFIIEYHNVFEKYNFVVATSKLLKFIKNDFSGIYRIK